MSGRLLRAAPALLGAALLLGWQAGARADEEEVVHWEADFSQAYATPEEAIEAAQRTIDEREEKQAAAERARWAKEAADAQAKARSTKAGAEKRRSEAAEPPKQQAGKKRSTAPKKRQANATKKP